MSTLLLGLRTLLFALSILGYLAFLHKHTQVKLEFLPAVTFAGQICILFLGGILNILSLTVTGLLATGLAFLLLSIKSHFDFRKFLCPAYVFFAVSCLYFLFLLKGQVFNSYDNFSRWANAFNQPFPKFSRQYYSLSSLSSGKLCLRIFCKQNYLPSVRRMPNVCADHAKSQYDPALIFLRKKTEGTECPSKHWRLHLFIEL